MIIEVCIINKGYKYTHTYICMYTFIYNYTYKSIEKYKFTTNNKKPNIVNTTKVTVITKICKRYS